MNNVLNPEVSDTTDDDSSTSAGYNLFLTNKRGKTMSEFLRSLVLFPSML
jgi:hypothetical protein